MSAKSTKPASAAHSYPLLVGHLLHTPLAVAPDQEIVYADFQRYDYRTFAERVARLANALESLGVGYGSTVAVMDWDSHRYLECFFGVPMMGAVLHTINVRLSPEQIAYTINHAEDDVLLVHRDFLPLVEALSPHFERPVKLVLLSEDDEAPETSLSFAGTYEELVAEGSPEHRFDDFDENTRATTFYTTGTTGDPKGVYFTHRQLVLHTLGVSAAQGASTDNGRFNMADVYMPITPMFHVHAWGMPYVATLMGCKQVYPGRYDPEKLLGLIEREEVTYSHCVPTILHMLLTCPKAQRTDLRQWKVIIGGSAMSKGLAKAAVERGIDVYGGYGMSETCPVLSVAYLPRDMIDAPAEEVVELRCKTGRPIPMVDMRIVDEQMRDVDHDGESAGEVVIRAPWATQGYFKSPEASEALWSGGYLHTGDIGNIDERGYLKVTDRLKDVIKSGGEWISSLELEDMVSQVPGVSEVAAIGIPDEKWGERPVVLVVPTDARAVSEDAIRNHVQGFADRGLISRWAVPDRVMLVESIDKTSVGKIDKKRLRDRFANGS